MKLKFLLLLFLMLIMINTSIYSLKMLEPLTKDLTQTNQVDLGYFSAGESFMVSFHLEGDEDYHTIIVDSLQINDVIIEITNKTQESIFTTIKLNENLVGNYSLKLILKSDDKTKEVILNMVITDNVIHTNLLNYNPKVRYEKKEIIYINVINKSNTTKTIRVTSDLPNTWFDYKKEKLNKEKTVILQPNSITKVNYEYFPKEIGTKIINLQINSSFESNTLINSENNVNYFIEIETIKDLRSIYGSKEHTYPLFNSNLIPIYFLNKIIKII